MPKPWYLVNTKIAGKWMFIPLKMVLIGTDPYPYYWYTGLCLSGPSWSGTPTKQPSLSWRAAAGPPPLRQARASGARQFGFRSHGVPTQWNLVWELHRDLIYNQLYITWVNYNDLTATSLESWLIRGIIPKWPYFRSVNYYNFPRI